MSNFSSGEAVLSVENCFALWLSPVWPSVTYNCLWTIVQELPTTVCNTVFHWILNDGSPGNHFCGWNSSFSKSLRMGHSFPTSPHLLPEKFLLYGDDNTIPFFQVLFEQENRKCPSFCHLFCGICLGLCTSSSTQWKKSQLVSSSDDWKQSKIFIRGSQYRWGNAHGLQWRKLQLEVRKRYYCKGGKFFKGSQSDGSILRDSFAETRRTTTGAYLDAGSVWPWSDSNMNFLQFYHSWATTSHFVLTQKPWQNSSLVPLYCLDPSKITEWFLLSN